MAERVVVGVDGSPGASDALRWAAKEAQLRGADLVACAVVNQSPDASAANSPALEQLSAAPAEYTGAFRAEIRHGENRAAAVLVAECTETDLLVVGSRGRNPLAAMLLGSVSRSCLTNAPCPVVVVHPGQHQARSHGRVIVGVDMSNTSRQALRVAAEEARIRAAGLHAVHAVHWDSVGGEWITPTTEQLVEWGQKLVEAELVRTDVAARTVIIHGKPRDVLVRHSAHADLLVLGARGRGSLAAMLLGSVSDYCAQHAHCPVMIVHPKEEVEAGPDSTPGSTISAR